MLYELDPTIAYSHLYGPPEEDLPTDDEDEDVPYPDDDDDLDHDPVLA